MSRLIPGKSIELGVCYYPEQWDEALWADDYKRMVEMGFTYVRVGEFAWSVFEPVQGSFSFDLFDRAISLAEECGLKVIMSTPTATPPAWLTHNHPEVLNVSKDGTIHHHGLRGHYNYNSFTYREFTKIIVEKLTKHYANHSAICGWQIGNEFNCEANVFYSDADHDAFREWVKQKYGTLDQLNDAWGTVFWNQTYSDWEQIFLPRITPADSDNPHHALDEKRFVSDSTIHFAKLQADMIRAHAPNHWVTTNGKFGHLNHHQLTNELLDFYAYDSYPNFGYVFSEGEEGPLLDRKWSWNLSTVRDISSQFAIFEQQSGPGGWVNRLEQPTPKPGQIKLWTYQSIAHGADMVLYFRWRTATKGTEMYWHGLNNYDNKPNRRLKEVETTGNELKRVGEELFGTHFLAEGAILHDYDNEWDGELDTWHGPFTGKSIRSWFKAFQYQHIPVDCFTINDDTTLDQLKTYKVLVYPHPAIMTSKRANLLERYCEQGGTLILGSRSGYKNEYGHAYMKSFPGLLSDLAGVEVNDFTRINKFDDTPHIEWGEHTLKTETFNEVLTILSEKTTVLASYQNSYYANAPALVKTRFGKGTCYYFGGVFNEQLASLLLTDTGLKTRSELTLPKNIELAIRASKGKEYFFLLNYSGDEQTITLNEPMNELLSNVTLQSTSTIEPYGVMILTKVKAFK
ncbi:beta-galactosidase [Alkalihalobacillus sp. NPDC078783]